MENILFLGYELTSSSLSIKAKKDGKGILKMHVDSVSSEDLVTNIDKKSNVLTYPIIAGIEGLSKKGEISLFECHIEAILRFKNNSTKKLTAKQLEKNSWFFENFAHFVAKELIDSLLDKTIYKQAVNLPPSRFDSESNE